MKTRTNQPIFKDDGTPFTDSQLNSDIATNGGTKLYLHTLNVDITSCNQTSSIISMEDTPTPLYFISSNPNPLFYDNVEQDKDISTGMGGVILIFNDNSCRFSTLSVVYSGNEGQVDSDLTTLTGIVDSVGDSVGVHYKFRGYVIDIVTPL